MQYKSLGGSDLLVSEICLGTMTFGRQITLEESLDILNYGFDNGINFLDSAEVYPVPVSDELWGKTEELIGQWLKYRKREDVIIATKIASRPRRKLDKKNIQIAVEGSLKRLGTDYIDLYQIHWPDRYVPLFGPTDFDIQQAEKTIDYVPIAEQVEAFAEQIDKGNIRYLGLSNETPWGLTTWQNTIRMMGLEKKCRIISVQNAYSLINRVFDGHLAETCYQEKIGLLGYSPLGFGVLTGKYLDGQKPDGARMTIFKDFGQRYCRDPRVTQAVSLYSSIADKYELTPAQLALAFCRSRWFIDSTIVGATTVEQLQEDLVAVNLELPPECLAEIDAVHKRLPNPAP